MLVSDGGQVIRVPVDGIRIASRATKGVTIFNTAEGEKVVSVERISEPEGDDEEQWRTRPPDGGVRKPAASEDGKSSSDDPASCRSGVTNTAPEQCFCSRPCLLD